MRNKGLLKFLMMFCFLGAVLVSCDKDDDEEEIDLDKVYHYELTIVGKWDKEIFGNAFPDGASFKSFVGLTHNSKNMLFGLGRKATDGLAEYSKSGNSDQLENEINQFISDERSSVLFKGGELSPEGEIKIEFETNLRHRYITLVGKIGPSPDWFVSIENLDLMELISRTLLFNVNDAGVKSGDAFTSSGQDTDEVITRVSKGELIVGSAIPTLGYVTIIRSESKD